MNFCGERPNWHWLAIPNVIDPHLVEYPGLCALPAWGTVQTTGEGDFTMLPENEGIKKEEPIQLEEKVEEARNYPTIQKIEEDGIQALQQSNQITTLQTGLENNIKVFVSEPKAEELTEKEDSEDYLVGQNTKKSAKTTKYEKTKCEKKKTQRPSSIPPEKFLEIIDSSEKVPPLEQVIKGYEEQLEVELQKEATESGDKARYISRQMDLARKNITQKYLRLFRLVLPFIKQEYNQDNLEKLKNVLSHSVSSIPTVMEIYREPDFRFFLDFLRQEVVTEERLPKFVMALPMRAAEKIIMLGGVAGIVYAINNPHVTLRSWYFDASDLLGDTTHIVQAIKENKIDYEEVVQMLTKVYQKVEMMEGPSKNLSKYSNVSCRYAMIIHQAFVEANAYGLISKQDEIELKELTKRVSKTASIGTVKQLLGYNALREYTKAKFIDNNRLIIQVLSDPTLNCRTKMGLIESYKSFERAVEDPQSLRRWQ